MLVSDSVCVTHVLAMLWSFFSVPFRFQIVVKKRLVKLVVNFLFYFRTDEEEVSWVNIWTPDLTDIENQNVASKIKWLFICQPIGALLLEQCRVEREDSQSFSIGEPQCPQSHIPISHQLSHTLAYWLVSHKMTELTSLCWCYSNCIVDISLSSNKEKYQSLMLMALYRNYGFPFNSCFIWLQHSWMKQRGSICLSVTLRSSVGSG